jgi:hypothetical protein
MQADDITPRRRDAFDESLTAELTSAAYAVALRHGEGGSWIELELELWRVLGDVVKKRQHDLAPSIPRHGRRPR